MELLQALWMHSTRCSVKMTFSSEAFNETVEELTQSLIRLVDENGMDWMYANCSATAQRGAPIGVRNSKQLLFLFSLII